MGIAALWLNLPEIAIQNAMFGWEYGNTAAALVAGDGFANPFQGVESGPTAWMPPAYVALLAAVFAVLGVKSGAALLFVLGMKYAALAVSLFILLRTAASGPVARYRWLLVLAFAGLIAANRSTWFLALHDPWLVLTLSCAMLACFVGRWRSDAALPRRSSRALALALPLISPALAAAFVALEVGGVVWRWRARGRSSEFSGSGRSASGAAFSIRNALILAALFTLSTSLWGARNWESLGLLIPTKSNIWFDLIQANEFDEDGLATNSTFMRFNPSNPNSIQAEYEQLGEAAFTQRYRARALSFLHENPGEMLRRIARRTRSALLFLKNPHDVIDIAPGSLDREDQSVIEAAGLAGIDWRGEPVWLSLGQPEDVVRSRLGALELRDPERTLDAWRDAREIVQTLGRHWTIIARAIALSTGPSLLIALGLLLPAVRRDPMFAAATALYLAYLLPYILVSHYLRYQVPMVGLQAVLAFRVGAGLWLEFNDAAPPRANPAETSES
jgi:hypothetical protein